MSGRKKKMLVRCSYQTIAPFVSIPQLLHYMDSIVERRTRLSFFKTLCANRILQCLTKNLIFHMLVCQVPKGKRRVSFPCRKQVFFRTDELQPSQQTLVSGVSFPKQVSRPPFAPLAGLCWFGLGSPGCRRCAQRLEKQAGTLKKARVWKRKTRVRCRGNVLVNTGCSYLGPFQVDHPVYLFQNRTHTTSFGPSATHLVAQDR